MTQFTLGDLLRHHRTQALFTQKELAKLIDYDHTSISRFERDERLPSQSYLVQFATTLQLSDTTRTELFDLYYANIGERDEIDIPSIIQTHHRESWGEAPDVTQFYGRDEELSKLREWLINDRCRLISLLAMGGTGKTMVATRLAAEISDNFHYVIWRTLRNAPPVVEILIDLIQFLSNHQESVLPINSDKLIAQLLSYLKQHRCLIILDNVEMILHETQAGDYQPEYEAYGRLFQQIGQSEHQSCLLLTSREKPRDIGPLESIEGPVRTLKLSGLDLNAATQVLTDRGLSGTEQGWKRLVHHYSGNPLALTLVAELVREVYDGDVDEFLAEDEIIFDQISDVIAEQFDRLSKLEQSLMFWLAVEREPVSQQTLRDNLAQPVPARTIMVALRSLRRRALIEKTAPGFTLQNVIMEYVTDRLINLVCRAINEGRFTILHHQGLLKVQTKTYIRHSQNRLILQPIIDNLLMTYDLTILEQHINDLWDSLRAQTLFRLSYAAGNLLNLRLRLASNLTDIDLSHLTIRQAYLRGMQLRDTNFSHAHFIDTLFFETFGLILSVAFSPDGRHLAAGTANGEIRLWDLQEDQQLPPLIGHTDWVKRLAFSPDSTMLLSGSVDQTVRVWDLTTGQCHYTLSNHSAAVTDVAVSSDGTQGLSSSLDGTVRLWNLTTGQEVSSLHRKVPLRALALSSDGRWLSTGDEIGQIQLWDFPRQKLVATLTDHNDSIRALCFSPNGQYLVSGGSDQTLRLWDMQTQSCRHTLIGHTQRVLAVSFSADGSLIVSSSDDQTIRVWNTKTGEPVNILRDHNDWIRAVACHPANHTFASGSDDQTLRLWDLSSGHCFKTLQGYTNIIWSVAVSPDGATLASGSDDRKIHLWDVETGQLLQTLSGHTARVWAIAFSPDGKTLASSSYDQTIKVWDLQRGDTRHILHGHTGQIWSVAFSPDGQLIASGSDDHTICLWDAITGVCRHTLHGHTAAVRQTIFSSAGHLFSCSEDGTIRRWDVSQATCLMTMTGHTRWIRALALSPDGKIIASGSDDRTIRLWNADTGQLLQTLSDQSGRVEALAFSPDGRFLASGGSDRMIHLWQADSGQHLKTLSGHTDRIRALTFNPTQPNHLISSSQDETIKVWDIDQNLCRKTFHPDRPYERMNITQATGLSAVQRATLKRLGAIETND